MVIPPVTYFDEEVYDLPGTAMPIDVAVPTEKTDAHE